ncbi:hypothetical protein CspeluHIS016_0309070 [Cutaneotrichosporon spelunceum]|uniref:Protein YIP n=1 Tax=Cutaneotrichosporon spelunceum TaxID=1672016 RepID=A0AAD3YCM6_9TREE|nr:hypothetical protein CspeluHIS016_0309070 [Cutaneotrichosporon spelunceum]
MSGGYTIVDVDEDESSGNLQFKSFLPDSTTRTPVAHTEVREVPFSPFNLAYYQTYFDVDTGTVLKRVARALVPQGGFIEDACDGQVDLYGPFWTLTTLILILYTTSTLTSSLQAYRAGESVVANIPLLSTATTLIYVYGLGVPAALWAGTRWLGVAEWSPAQALGIYGYAMAAFLPVSLLCLIPYTIARWVFVGLGAVASGFFLITNILPVFSQEHKWARLLVVAVGVLHAGVAIAMKILFYSYAVAGQVNGDDVAPAKRMLQALLQ